MSTIHCARLSLLLSLLEISWFSTEDTKQEIEHFFALVKNARGIVLNTAHSQASAVEEDQEGVEEEGQILPHEAKETCQIVVFIPSFRAERRIYLSPRWSLIQRALETSQQAISQSPRPRSVCPSATLGRAIGSSTPPLPTPPSPRSVIHQRSIPNLVATKIMPAIYPTWEQICVVLEGTKMPQGLGWVQVGY